MSVKNPYKLLLLTILLMGCTAQQIQQARKTIEDALAEETLTSADVANGLKEALVQGANNGTSTISKLNGYYNNPQIKIPFPPDVQNVADKLRAIGMGDQVDRFVQTLNRGAEEAAKEAGPIFVNAIKSMSIADAWNILKGDDDAATQYLKRTTSDDLEKAFNPVIKNALEKTQATKYYSDLVNAYNKIPLVEDVNPNLDQYATARAMEGVFFMIAKEEKNIRENPVARTTDLLKKVFSQQD
jgi:hypothetical protein